MQIRFFGAAGEVTGSCYLVETDRARVLVDFGLHQGGPQAEKRNRRFPAFDPRRLSAVILTHAHLDHSGRLPLLSQRDFNAPVYATPATIDLTEIVLLDAAKIQMEDAQRENRRREREHRAPVVPFYTEDDAKRLLRQLAPLGYDAPKEIAPGVSIRLVDAGHILGSASVEMTIREGGATRIIAFSGDLGPKGQPLMRDPTPIGKCDVMVLESTYGDRDHQPQEASEKQFLRVIRDSMRTGKVIIPSFAIGRTQRLIYTFDEALRHGDLPGLKVYVDSPMATEVTELYCRHRELFGDEDWARLTGEKSCLYFRGLHFTRNAQESRALNDRRDGLVVIASAGMCTGGRVLHHLKHGLWKPDTHVVFVGFQAEGTLGRRLVEGEKRVRVMNETVAVKAQIHTINGFSAHAGRGELIEWAGHAAKSRPRVMLTHGENPQRRALGAALEQRFGLRSEFPEWGETINL